LALPNSGAHADPDELKPEGIVITKRGKPVARVYPARRGDGDLIGLLNDMALRVDPDDELFSTGAWVSDEWGNLNPPPLPTKTSSVDTSNDQDG
jgi:hypothetical protein